LVQWVRGANSFSTTMEELEYYTEEGEPIRCVFCESIRIDYRTKEIVANVVAELQYFCCDCNEEVGYWAYGYFDPKYKQDYHQFIKEIL